MKHLNSVSRESGVCDVVGLLGVSDLITLVSHHLITAQNKSLRSDSHHKKDIGPE